MTIISRFLFQASFQSCSDWRRTFCALSVWSWEKISYFCFSDSETETKHDSIFFWCLDSSCNYIDSSIFHCFFVIVVDKISIERSWSVCWWVLEDDSRLHSDYVCTCIIISLYNSTKIQSVILTLDIFILLTFASRFTARTVTEVIVWSNEYYTYIQVLIRSKAWLSTLW